MLFGCRINLLSTICILEEDFMKFGKNLWLQQYKIMKNMEKPHFFDKNQKLISNYGYHLKVELFLYICGKNCIQDAIILKEVP